MSTPWPAKYAHTSRPRGRLTRAPRDSRCSPVHHRRSRLGGDEFGVLLEDVPDTQSARRVADRLQDALKAPFVLHGQEVFCGASIGIAHGSASYVQPEDIMRDADTALYRAKGQGRGRWV